MFSVSRRALSGVAALVGLIALTRPVSAHVDYVTDPPAATRAALAFLREVLASPVNLALLGGGTLLTVVALVGFLLVRPTIPDVAALRDALEGYAHFVPWMLRLSVGLPLLGAGFAGYLFSPAVPVEARVAQVALGFLILFGLATRLLAAAGLLAYLGTLVAFPELILAVEYVPGFLALGLLGSGRPSADHMLREVADAPGTWYGRIDPVHGVVNPFERAVAPYERYVPTVLRVGLGVAFVYLGVTQKLADPARALLVVEKYDLTAVVPVDPGLWVAGAGLVEAGVGLLLIAGYLTRAVSAVAFLMLVMTLFGLPDDPVLAHVTLFGMLSATFTLGSGPLAVDNWIAARAADRDPDSEVSPAD